MAVGLRCVGARALSELTWPYIRTSQRIRQTMLHVACMHVSETRGSLPRACSAPSPRAEIEGRFPTLLVLLLRRRVARAACSIGTRSAPLDVDK